MLVSTPLNQRLVKDTKIISCLSTKNGFIDFKRYSRFLNPENSSYDFGLKSLIAEKVRITSELAARY